ncbi:Protein CBG08445 [Caenorhabditis briggsae]|nr:Protein CBG04875 [Caenorhabditis briggsae]XP_002640399.1 Protein CBG08445 [Caenorhabditis briggsae]CAP25503.1 Protein CBG04875 [Caenorhabditis briggsae]CAP28266.1 Protein CBG08445 [Caenorhabditis briggsae]
MARSHPNVDSLKAALLKAWDDLDDDYLRRTVASVPARLKACIKAEGSNFEYLL